MQHYVHDSDLLLLRRKGFAGIAYTDGEQAERRIYDAVCQAGDRGTFSLELAQAITDWPSEYHLSRRRHCLVRPLGIRPGDKVLELGCGCGAITRFLGELGADVTAVEGSPQRARIASERCRDLPNVKVFVDDLLQFRCEDRFDWILLVGVLEYAPVFSDSADPTNHFLLAAAQFLGPEATLVVAIENKLGLKYFNGCSEDHVSVPCYGIQGLYGPRTPRTFGRSELEAHLKAVGLSNIEFHYPFPDYKLPTVIISHGALSDPLFDPVDLLASCHARDYTGSPYRLFDDALVFAQAASNGLLADLSNSFLVAARARPVTRKADVDLAVTYAVDRVPEFTTETRFARLGERIEVVKEGLQPGISRRRAFKNGRVLANSPTRSDYVRGRLALWRLLKARAESGSLQQVVDALEPWFEFILQHAADRSQVSNDRKKRRKELSDYLLPGYYLDLTPYNLMETGATPVPIDMEWKLDGLVPLGWVITRSIINSLAIGVPLQKLSKDVTDVIRALCSARAMEVSDNDIEDWWEWETQLHAAVTGQQLPQRPISIIPSSGLLSLRGALAERDLQVASLADANTASKAQFERLEKDTVELRGKLAGLTSTIAERGAQIRLLTESLAERDKQITQLRESIFQCDRQIAALNEAATERDELRVNVTRLRVELARAKSAGGRVRAELSQVRSENERRDKELAQKGAEVDDLRSELTRRTEESERREAALPQEQAESERLRAELSQRIALYDATLATVSWRITTPLRWIWRFPRVARYCRAMLRIAWWSVTFQLVHRLRVPPSNILDRETTRPSLKPLDIAALKLPAPPCVAAERRESNLASGAVGNVDSSQDQSPRLVLHREPVRAGDRIRHKLKPGLKRALGPSLSADLSRLLAIVRNCTHRRRYNAAPASSEHSLDAYKETYLTHAQYAMGALLPSYAPPILKPPPTERCDVKFIAYYLPQFHPIPENDEWWGKGFTEWRNVTRAFPVFRGHDQPRLPGELGYYDLRVPEVMRRQVELAKLGGISAFCFHFYWFGGKRLLELPLENFLQDKDLDFKFCLCWANENWTRRWDGAEKEILIAQSHSAEDDVAFIRYLKKYFDDPRYLRIEGKPALSIYRPEILPDARATVRRWRAEAEAMGYPGIYLIATNSFDFSRYQKFGFDALSEFPPHSIRWLKDNNATSLHPDFQGGVFSYSGAVNEILASEPPLGKVLPGVMPGWDNTPRRLLRGNCFSGSTPTLFYAWLIHSIARARRNGKEERLVFINAWNEWAEGACLEPDRKTGYAYLAACAAAISDSADDHPRALLRYSGSGERL